MSSKERPRGLTPEEIVQRENPRLWAEIMIENPLSDETFSDRFDAVVRARASTPEELRRMERLKERDRLHPRIEPPEYIPPAWRAESIQLERSPSEPEKETLIERLRRFGRDVLGVVSRSELRGETGPPEKDLAVIREEVDHLFPDSWEQ